MSVDSGRITNPKVIEPREIAAACEKRGQLVVQFHERDAYDPALLSLLNQACALAQDRLQVRFYSHPQAPFDAKSLRHLPEVRDLSVDCLRHIIEEDEIGRLPRLKRLHFGVFEFDRPGFLSTIDLSRLESLILSENRKRNFDLSPLARCGSLQRLFIHGHSKGIHSITQLPRLTRLTLGSYAKTNPLDFIEAIPNLRALSLILGGRANIDDLSSKTVEYMQLIRVRGLATVGDLSRLPALSALKIEDQIQLTEVILKDANLERLCIFNCKKLAALPGLETQHRLREFTAGGVALDLNALRDRDWPSSTRSVRLFSGSLKWNQDAAAQLAERGVGESGGPWPF